MALAFFGCLDLVLAFMLFVSNGDGETLTKYESITFLINTLSFVYSFPEILKLISEAIKEKDLSDYILHICDVVSEMTFLKDRSSGVRFYNIACLLKAMQSYIPYDFKRSSRELVYRMFLGEIPPSCLLILAKYAYDCYLWSDSEKKCYDLFFRLMKQESIKVFIDCLTPKEREIFDKISKFIGNQMVPASEQELQKIEKFLKVCYKLKCDGIKEGDIDGRNKIVKPEYTQEFLDMLGKIKRDERFKAFMEHFQSGKMMASYGPDAAQEFEDEMRVSIYNTLIFKRIFPPGFEKIFPPDF